MPADDTADVGVQADQLADQTLRELDALDAALAQTEAVPPISDAAPEPAAEPEETLPLERRKEFARTAASRIGDIVKLADADEAAAAIVPAEVPRVSAEEREAEIARIKAGLNP